MITASERLGLRYYRPEDTAPIFNIYTGHPGSAKYLARQPHSDVEQTERMLKKLSNSESLVANGMCVWVIEAIRDGTAAGLITVAKDDTSIAVHFGIGTPNRGRGFAAEALALTAQHLLTTGQTACVSSFTDIENAAAQTALVKAGFVVTGRTENFYRAPQLGGKCRDVFRFQFRP